MLEESYGAALKALHTSAVTKSIAGAGDNRVLGRPPPKLSASELRLPRDLRCTLAQLRSGFSKTLREFLHRIGAVESKICPECGSDDHTTTHLFNCAAFPTSLFPSDLWQNPIAVANFLSHQASFFHLSELEPPAPRPPPEPPPL